MSTHPTRPSTAKATLRQEIRRRSAEADPALLHALSLEMGEAIEQLELFRQATTIALYWSLPGEVQTHQWVERWAQHKRILLPVMVGEGLILRPFTSREQLSKERFGVLEPALDPTLTTTENPLGTIPLHEVDLIIIPGVAFDRQGGRLGHGKGFYDRLLSGWRPTLQTPTHQKNPHPSTPQTLTEDNLHTSTHLPSTQPDPPIKHPQLPANTPQPLKMGVCFDFQLCAKIPTEAQDITMDEILCGSPREIRRFTIR